MTGLILGVSRNGLSHCRQEILVVNRFRKKIRRPVFHGADAHGNVTVTRDEDDGYRRRERLEFPLQFEPAQARHANIEHDTTGGVALADAVEELTCRGESLHCVTSGL